MTHTLFTGVTQSGKTTMARHFCRQFDKMGQRTIVYDPVGTITAGGDWPERSVKFDDPEEFMEYVNRDDVYHAHIFVDEAGDHFGVSDKDNHWLFRRGRHKGFILYPIAQRPKMLAPNVRTQCGKAYVFRLAKDDANEVGADFGHSNLHNIITTLDVGDYIMLTSGSPEIKRGNIFNQLGRKPAKVQS